MRSPAAETTLSSASEGGDTPRASNVARPVSCQVPESNSSAINMSRCTCSRWRGGANTAGDSVSSRRTLSARVEIADVDARARGIEAHDLVEEVPAVGEKLRP